MTGLRVSYQHAIPCYTRRWNHDEQCEYEHTALSKEDDDIEQEEMERGQDRSSNIHSVVLATRDGILRSQLENNSEIKAPSAQ
jgi:hypothetical protein